MDLIFIDLGLLCWFSALTSWVFDQPYITVLLAVLAGAAFIIHYTKKGSSVMFGKNIAKKEEHPLSDEKNSDRSHGTVIARGVCFEGNITATGPVYIYGTVTGNIYAREGKINVMQHGSVMGNVESQSLIVDGAVNGESCAEHVEICEHGRVEGRLRYSSLSIVQGGVLAGDMAHCSEVTTGNIVDFSPEQEAVKEIQAQGAE